MTESLYAHRPWLKHYDYWVPDTDIKVVDLETGETELPIGEAGELCISGRK